MTDTVTSDPGRYDPWRDLGRNWPEIDVVLEPMRGLLLGELRYPVIALRAGTSMAQRRCTLAHELVHLERGTTDCGPWAVREEVLVHATAALRLVRKVDLEQALRDAGGDGDLAALAHALDVDTHTARVRLGLLSAAERWRLRSRLSTDFWHVA
jgi:hypothetical protein